LKPFPGIKAMREPKAWMAIVVLSIETFMLTTGCGNHAALVVAPEQIEKSPLSFLENGVTTKQEVSSRFGIRPVPKTADDEIVIFSLDRNGQIQGKTKDDKRLVREFENGRVLVIDLDKKYRIPSSVQKVKFQMVLVFDEADEGVLIQHSLVRIR
jgi:hypothetical protein